MLNIHNYIHNDKVPAILSTKTTDIDSRNKEKLVGRDSKDNVDCNTMAFQGLEKLGELNATGLEELTDINSQS